MREVGERIVKKVPTLRGRTIVNLFFEASTRTRASFEIAGKRLSADVVNFSPSSSSLKKSESILDTAKTLDAMDPDVDFSAVLHEVPIEIRRRLAPNESGFTESVTHSEESTFCRGCRRTLSVVLHFGVNNKTCRQCLIRQRLKRKRCATRNSEQFGNGRTTEARKDKAMNPTGP